MKKTLKTKLALMSALMLVMCMCLNTAFACTSIYVGSALTDDGSTIFARSEDYSNSQNKLFYVSPAGKHVTGEVYEGCYGFTWTFTHDSYSYTAFSDDNGAGVDGVCPDCDDDHPHSPYEAAGTNSEGLTVTATETIYGSEKLEEVDPFEDLGIEEAEIVTVLLGEASNAKEALSVLTSIYDTAGANSGSGIIIADNTEAWYIENVTGHQYIAVKLSDTMIMVQPNMMIIGEIDLNDTENVIASPELIDVAQKAGTFVGDEEKGIINYTLSYGEETSANARMLNAIPCIGSSCEIIDGEVDPAAYLITNLDENGEITAMHTGLEHEGAMTIADVQNFYHISNIGYVRNLETHIFQLYSGNTATDTVEWVAMNDAAINVFVPYYPMLTTDTIDAYKLSTATAEFVEEEPTEGLYYPTSVNRWIDGQRVAVEGYKILPANWADSYYWTFDALSNLIMYCDVDEDAANAAIEALYTKQAEINASFDEFKAEFDATADDAADIATAFSGTAAADVYQTALDLTNGLIGE